MLQDDRVSHQGQPIALVIAGTLEQANHAATLVRVTYAPESGMTDISQVEPVLPTQQKTDPGTTLPPETRRGDPEGALATAQVKIDQSCRVANANFAEYAVPVHADAPPVMDVMFVEEHDPHVNPLGVKGVGEIAMVGVAPAITNAIFHATGKRVRELPVTPDKLL